MNCVLSFIQLDVVEIITIITESLFALDQVRCINVKINDCDRIERIYDAFTNKIEGYSKGGGYNRVKYKIGSIRHRSYDKPYYITENGSYTWNKMGWYYRKNMQFDFVGYMNRYKTCEYNEPLNKPYNIYYSGRQVWNTNRIINEYVLPVFINEQGIRKYNVTYVDNKFIYDNELNILDDSMLTYFLNISRKNKRIKL